MTEQQVKGAKPGLPSDELMTVRQTAAWMGMAAVTIYRLAARGELPGRKVGGQWRFVKSHLETWICTGDAPDGRPWHPLRRLTAAALDHEEAPTC